MSKKTERVVTREEKIAVANAIIEVLSRVLECGDSIKEQKAKEMASIKGSELTCYTMKHMDMLSAKLAEQGLQECMTEAPELKELGTVLGVPPREVVDKTPVKPIDE